MRQQVYQSAELRDLRAAAAEISRYREEAKGRLEAAAVSGDVAAGGEILAEATRKTNEFAEQRSKLGAEVAFLAKYGVHVINDHTILFVLPKGSSRIEVLDEAERLVTDSQLIIPRSFEDWSADERFTRPVVAPERICIDGHVKGGDAKTRFHQMEVLAGKGVELASQEDLAVAFALHWVAMKEPLFGWYKKAEIWSYAVRAAIGSLFYSHGGLVTNIDKDVDTYPFISVSASVSRSKEPVEP